MVQVLEDNSGAMGGKSGILSLWRRVGLSGWLTPSLIFLCLDSRLLLLLPEPLHAPCSLPTSSSVCICPSTSSPTTVSRHAAFPEQRVIFFSPQNPTLIYSSQFVLTIKGKQYVWNQCLNVNQNLIYGRQGIFIVLVFVFWDKNSLFMKKAVLTQIPLFLLQHIH